MQNIDNGYRKLVKGQNFNHESTEFVEKNITLTARAFRGDAWSWIHSVKHLFKQRYSPRPHSYYKECADKNIPEYRLGLFQIASCKGHSQWNHELNGDCFSYAVEMPPVYAQQPNGVAPKNQINVQGAKGNKAQNNADCNNHNPRIGTRSLKLNKGITLTARELQGLEQSICKWPDTRKRPDDHYDQRTDQGVPENALGFFNVSNDKSYNQGDTDSLRQNYESLHEGNSGSNTDIPKIGGKPNAPYPKSQDRENQNNADYIAHLSIVGSFLPNLNQRITLTARAFRGSGWSWMRSRRCNLRIKPNSNRHYKECSDKNIPEYRLGFFKVSSCKGYRQWNADEDSDHFGYAAEIQAAPTKEIEIATRPQMPVKNIEGDKAQNNADCNDHMPIRSTYLNYCITLTARAFRGVRKTRGRVSQGDVKSIPSLIALSSQQTTSNLVGKA